MRLKVAEKHVPRKHHLQSRGAAPGGKARIHDGSFDGGILRKVRWGAFRWLYRSASPPPIERTSTGTNVYSVTVRMDWQEVAHASTLLHPAPRHSGSAYATGTC